jgi:tetratricopeptide (TPR) repeat protein
MKKIVLAMLLVATVTAVAQTAAPAQPASQQNPAPGMAAPNSSKPQTATPPAAASPSATPAAAPQQGAPAASGQQSAAPAAPAQKKEIKDPAEYNAYVGAVQQTDPAAKVSGLEAFLTQYPNSVMKEDALAYLMAAYQQTGNQAKMLETSQKVLQANPCNIRALALVAYTKQAMGVAGQNAQQNFTEAGQAGEKGLQCLQTAAKPADTNDADWNKLKTQTTNIFNSAAGIAAYNTKDFAKAEQYLRPAVEADPTNLLNVYDLALSYLAPGAAEKDVDGLYFIARAAALAQGAGKDQIAKFGKSRYVKYHGSEDGWTNLLAQAASTPLPPANFTITQYVPPTPAQQAADLVKTKKVEEMSFAEWQLVLSEGTPEDAEKVWSVLKGKPLQMVAHVIAIESTSKLQLAGSQDDIDAKRADIDLTMTAGIPSSKMPKVDTDFQFEGTPESYTPKPFLMVMDKGALLVKAAPKKPAATHKKPAAH